MLFCELIGNKLDYTHIHFNDFWKLWEKKKKKGPERRNDTPIFPPFVAEETIPLPAVL